MSSSLRVAVTGGSGRVGSAVVRELVGRGHTVLNLDRRLGEVPVPGAKFVYVDLRRREQVQPVLDTVDAVCHLGEIPNPTAPISGDELFGTNTAIGSVVLQTAADLKLRHVVYTSTCQVYGTWGYPVVPPLSVPLDESHPVRPQNTYALSKVANESFARYVAERQGLSTSVFRLPVVHVDVRDRWFDWVERHDEPPDELNCYVHVTDAATAYAEAVERALPGCETYHFAADEIMGVVPIAQSIARHRPTWPQLPTDWPAYKSPLLTGRAREKLGWAPKYNFLDEYRKKKGREPLLVPREGGPVPKPR